MKLFISGWAGFREALGDIPQQWYFICPFIDFDEEGILSFLEDKSGDSVVGWSTGGHIVLKNFEFFSKRFRKIIIVAGFNRFTDYVNSKILKKMQKKMELNPDSVIKDFLINAGCSCVFPPNIDYKKLIKGLEFLLTSKIDLTCSSFHELILIQGINDRILPIKAIEDLKTIFPFAKTYKVEGPHWIKFRKILSIEPQGGLEAL